MNMRIEMGVDSEKDASEIEQDKGKARKGWFIFLLVSLVGIPLAVLLVLGGGSLGAMALHIEPWLIIAGILGTCVCGCLAACITTGISIHKIKVLRPLTYEEREPPLQIEPISENASEELPTVSMPSTPKLPTTPKPPSELGHSMRDNTSNDISGDDDSERTPLRSNRGSYMNSLSRIEPSSPLAPKKIIIIVPENIEQVNRPLFSRSLNQ